MDINQLMFDELRGQRDSAMNALVQIAAEKRMLESKLEAATDELDRLKLEKQADTKTEA